MKSCSIHHVEENWELKDRFQELTRQNCENPLVFPSQIRQFLNGSVLIQRSTRRTDIKTEGSAWRGLCQRSRKGSQEVKMKIAKSAGFNFNLLVCFKLNICLGFLPHQIRKFLGEYKAIQTTLEQFK